MRALGKDSSQTSPQTLTARAIEALRWVGGGGSRRKVIARRDGLAQSGGIGAIEQMEQRNCPDLVASNITQVFASYWKDFWGPQSEQLLKQGILAQLELGQGTILGVYAMLLSHTYRAHV